MYFAESRSNFYTRTNPTVSQNCSIFQSIQNNKVHGKPWHRLRQRTLELMSREIESIYVGYRAVLKNSPAYYVWTSMVADTKNQSILFSSEPNSPNFTTLDPSRILQHWTRAEFYNIGSEPNFTTLDPSCRCFARVSGVVKRISITVQQMIANLKLLTACR
jgi:hypothetical protein